MAVGKKKLLFDLYQNCVHMHSFIIGPQKQSQNISAIQADMVGHGQWTCYEYFCLKYRDSLVSVVFWFPANRTIGKTALIGD